MPGYYGNMKKPTPHALRRIRTISSIGKHDDLWFFAGLSEEEVGLPVVFYIGRGFMSRKPYFWIVKRLLLPSRSVRKLCAILIIRKGRLQWRSWGQNLHFSSPSERRQVERFVQTHKKVLLVHWSDPYLDAMDAWEALQESMKKAEEDLDFRKF